MAVLEDLVVLLVGASIGIAETPAPGNVFWSSKAAIPSGDGPYLSMIETGGSGPEGTHNAAAIGSLPAYVRPNVQIIVRGKVYAAVRAMIDAAYGVIAKTGERSQLINSVWYRSMIPLQEPFDFGTETGTGRIVYVFNVAITKRPNAAAS